MSCFISYVESTSHTHVCVCDIHMCHIYVIYTYIFIYIAVYIYVTHNNIKVGLQSRVGMKLKEAGNPRECKGREDREIMFSDNNVKSEVK